MGVQYYNVRDVDLSNQLKFDFVTIDGGCFKMGSFKEPIWPNQKSHEVCVDDFSMSKTEITYKQYRLFRSNHDNGSYGGKDYNVDSYPVQNVSYENALQFIEWINRLDLKYKYRLPAEAEWEYACSSKGKDEDYCGGNQVNSVGWHYFNSDLRPHAVGASNPNGIGLFDMTGNVSEWVSDYYDGGYYEVSPKYNPKGPLEDSGLRQAGGGGWNEEPQLSTTRSWI